VFQLSSKFNSVTNELKLGLIYADLVE